MPRKTRKEVRKEFGADEEQLPIEELARTLDREPTKSIRHIRCPLCGIVAHREEFETPRKRIVLGIEGGPYFPVGRWQQYGGGSLPSHTGDMKDRPGLMIWSEEEDITEEERQLMISKLREALEMLEG